MPPPSFRYVLNSQKNSAVRPAPSAAPATTSIGRWIPLDHLLQLTMSARRKVRTPTGVDCAKYRDAVQMENDTAA